jgi:ATP-dependent RNA helicase DbpA
VSKALFSSLPVSDKILTAASELGFENLTPIQEQSIPPLLEGKDLIGQSKTGSGKTVSFTVPILQKMKLSERRPQALILCPTRELSTQVARDVRNLGRRFESLQVVILCGGQKLYDQAKSLDGGVHIVVGTPGRVLDLLDRARLDLSEVTTLVMDEADKMLEMGFEDEVEAILQAVPSTRQTVFFSATFPEKMESLSKRYQKAPVRVTVENDLTEAPLIEELAYETDSSDKVNLLMRVLQQHTAPSILIFCNQKITVAEIVNKLIDQGASAGALHGDLEQRDRDRAMSMFRNESFRILVATDVAARGLDIENLELVINFDLPHQTETYIHRIGRTGRAGRTGMAISLVGPDDGMKLYAISQVTGRKFSKPKLGFKNQHGLSPDLRGPLMQTLSISGGRKDKLRPGDILGALTSEAGGLSGSDVGKIEVQDHLSYVAVSTSKAKTALACLSSGKIKGQKFRIKLEE